MKKIMFVVMSLALATGCGGGGAEELIGKLRGFKNDMCKCTTQECVDKVDKDMMGWMLKNADKFKNVKPTKAQEEQADKIEDEMRACKDKVENAAAPAPAPAPATP